jgi:transcriptional regulator with AAA-type ATPase domain
MLDERAGIQPIEDNPGGVKLTLQPLRTANRAKTVHVARDVARLGQSKPLVVTHGAMRSLVGRTVADVERNLILDTLEHHLGNRTHAANVLGISIRTLRNKLSEYASEGVPIPPPGSADTRKARDENAMIRARAGLRSSCSPSAVRSET